ncbi:tetratricopeptide repeat protein, partial [Chloroflexota bacterium]
MKKKPKESKVYHDRGFTYYLKRDYDSAILDLTRAIELNPSSASSHYIRGLAYKGKRKFDLAITNFKKAVSFSKDPDAAKEMNMDLVKELGEYLRHLAP